MHYMLTALTVAGLFVATGCASTEGSASGEKSAETVAAINTAGENPANPGEEVKAAGETEATTTRRCRAYTPTGSHRAVRSCTGAGGGDSKVQSVDKDDYLRETVTRGVINTRLPDGVVIGRGPK